MKIYYPLLFKSKGQTVEKVILASLSREVAFVKL
jgi:hypothetical protein